MTGIVLSEQIRRKKQLTRRLAGPWQTDCMKPLIDKRPIFLTWLPLSHSYEHTVQFAQIAVGAKVFYAEKIEKLLDNISESKPSIMTAVPRFYQNLYNKININMKKAKGLKAKLIKSTIFLGRKKLLKQKMKKKNKKHNNENKNKIKREEERTKKKETNNKTKTTKNKKKK